MKLNCYQYLGLTAFKHKIPVSTPHDTSIDYGVKGQELLSLNDLLHTVKTLLTKTQKYDVRVFDPNMEQNELRLLSIFSFTKPPLKYQYTYITKD